MKIFVYVYGILIRLSLYRGFRTNYLVYDINDNENANNN